ncbi:MAG: signal peptide peptidase SppA [Bacteroidales bacterium]
MKDFFKFMFASMLGFILTMLIFMFISLGFVMTIISFAQPEDVEVNDKSLLHIKFDYMVEDRTSNNPMQFAFDFESFNKKPGLNEIIKNIKKAKSDDRIKGIYLDLWDVSSGLATISELREALHDFKTSGKFIYVYADILTQKAYYFATVADKIFLNPEGMLELKGYSGNVVFIKGLLEKLDIEPQIIRHGKYKSAIEPLILDKMSDANREQTLAFVQSMWDKTVEDISISRNISVSELNRIADGLEGQNVKKAYQLNLIDSVLYYDQFLILLGEKIGVETIKSENLISISKYTNVEIDEQTKKRSKNKVAVIYASGDIVQGNGGENAIGSDKISRTIRSARLDESIKAVVLRVNSPGGDGLASDIILREVVLTKEVKPVVVSMGNLAASGGYYIACGASKILAHENTITGSIGVFGLVPNFQDFFYKKLGITFDGIQTNENSDFFGVTKPLSDFQYDMLQNEVDRFYNTFIGHVAAGRNMTVEQVDEVAQGRVWSGRDALGLGLVDEIGGLDDAIQIAVELAELEDFRVIDLPKQKEPFEQFLNDLMGQNRTGILQNELGENYKYFRYIQEVSRWNGVQARIPFEITVD